MSSNFLNSVTAQIWANSRHLTRCVKIIRGTWDVRTLYFMADQPILFFFKPSQFVTLELETDGGPVMRSYTISSSPSAPYSPSITIKQVPGGRVSNWLHDSLKEGQELPVHDPVGLFNAIDFPANRVLLLSGGVSVAPVMSMARRFFDTSASVDMVFVHGTRSSRDITYHHGLEYMASWIDNFSLHIICRRHGLGETWADYRSYLNLRMLELIVPDFLEREIFCCGPIPYMSAVKHLLQGHDYDMNRHYEEALGPTPPEVHADVRELTVEAAGAPEISVADQYQVELTATGKSVCVGLGETVHAIAAKLGLHTPKACGMGICGTCRVMKTAGEVEMEHNGGITDEGVTEDYIPPYYSVPKGDTIIDY